MVAGGGLDMIFPKNIYHTETPHFFKRKLGNFLMLGGVSIHVLKRKKKWPSMQMGFVG